MEFYRMAVFLSFFRIGLSREIASHDNRIDVNLQTQRKFCNFISLVYLFLVVDRTIIPLDKIFLMEDYLIFDVSLILEKLVINDS